MPSCSREPFMPAAIHTGVVSEDFAAVDPEGWGPAGISHAVVFGTLTTMCGRALEPFYSFYEHSFAEEGLICCATCVRLAGVAGLRVGTSPATPGTIASGLRANSGNFSATNV